MNHKLDTDTQVFFYEQDFYVLSNFSAFRLFWSELDFDTSEHAYHWEKFRPGSNVAYLIMHARSAHEAFKIAERYKAERRPNWDAGGTDRAATSFANGCHPDDQRDLPADANIRTGVPPAKRP